MKRLFLAFFVLIVTRSFSQTVVMKPGDHAPSFILTLDANSIQSYVMPYTPKIVMLHFWSSDVITSKMYGKQLREITKRYKNVGYKSAEGFEVIAIAVQTNKKAWKKDIAGDSLTGFTHGIALNGFEDDPCKKYGIVSLPTDILIDETGKVIAVDPKMPELENILDERKNYQPVNKDVVGVLAQSSDKAEVLKFSKLYLFNNYGDSVGKTTTSATGRFTFSNIKLNQDFILKVDNQTDILTSDPVALYTPTGDLLMNGVTNEGGFIFHIPARLSIKLTESDKPAEPAVIAPQPAFVKHIEFTNDGEELSAADKKELLPVFNLYKKNKKDTLEFTTHTDTKVDDVAGMYLTLKQANTLSSYFEKKGIAKTRIKAVPKGNDEPKITCGPTHTCTEEEHKQNRRVEFFSHRN